MGELEGTPRIVVEVDRGRAMFCDELSGGSEEGIVGVGENVSEEG